MRIRLALPALLVALLAACSGNTNGASTNPKPSPTAVASVGSGSVDCATIKTAAQELLSIQFLAQLTTPDNIQSIKTHQIGNLDLDKFLGAMHELHALDSFSGPLGDPKAAINFYEDAGKAAQVLFATDPMTQAAIDTYNQHVGTVSEFLGHQIAISGALDAAGC